MSQVTQRWRSPYLITQPLSYPVIPSTSCQAHTFICGKKAFNHVNYFSPFARSFFQDGKPLRHFRTEIPCLEGYFHWLVKLEASITTPNHTELELKMFPVALYLHIHILIMTKLMNNHWCELVPHCHKFRKAMGIQWHHPIPLQGKDDKVPIF